MPREKGLKRAKRKPPRKKVDPYRIGYCPQCGTQIMVKDLGGRWSTFKRNYSQADLVFEDGHVVRTPICSKCIKDPDVEKIYNAIVTPESRGSDRKVLDKIQSRGKPRGIKEYSRK